MLDSSCSVGEYDCGTAVAILSARWKVADISAVQFGSEVPTEKLISPVVGVAKGFSGSRSFWRPTSLALLRARVQGDFAASEADNHSGAVRGCR